MLSTGLEQSAVSHALKKLRFYNLVFVKRKGRERIYTLNRETITPLLNLVRRHLNSGKKRISRKRLKLSWGHFYA